jgi:hypothetical protein
MSEQHKNSSRSNGARALTWAGLVLIPALAIVGLGTGVSWTMSGPSTQGGLQTAETREFAANGDAVAATTQPVKQNSIGEFSDSWQNTVRIPPSPRR